MEEFNSMSSYTGMDTKKERHGFVTFWLWLGIISSIIMIPSSIMTYTELLHNSIDIAPSGAITAHIFIMGIVAVISSICMVIFYIQIKRWKKSGFWGIVVTAIITAIINTIIMSLINSIFREYGLSPEPNITLITTPISLLVLFGILQFKKNGISCWKQLESRPHKDSSSDIFPDQNKENRKKKIGLLILMGVLITAATSAIVVFIRYFTYGAY